MKKIEINIKDKARFEVVASFLDQPKLEKIIINLRKRLNLRKSLIPYKDFQNFYKIYIHYQPSKKEIDYYNQMLEKSDLMEAQGYPKDEIEKLEKEIAKWQDSKYIFLLRIDKILNKFNKGLEFKNLLIKAIICGEVDEQDFTAEVRRKGVRHVKRDREWYWINRRTKGKNRKGYGKLAKDTGETLRTIENAVKSYKSRL